ncbi:hypothetical protein [Bacillus cereus]|uniref:hypothetical protein n=1 Tax=Bacillus cereus TaxID=1396 RepID=UPI003D2F022F
MERTKKNVKGAGRKPKVYEEQVILNLIYSCIKEMKVVGRTKWQVVYPYCLKLYEDKKIDFKLSEDFWRKPDRQGTLLLKKINAVVEEEVEVDERDIVSVVNTEDAINKLYDGKESNKKKLVDMLRLNEVKLKKYIEECRRLNNKVNKLKEDLETKKNEAQEWKDKFEELQRTMFLLMEYSESKNFPIVNILNTGKAKTEAVAKQLESLFLENPIVGYEYDQYIKNKKLKQEQQDNIIKISKSKGKSAADDFGLL